MNLEGDAKLNNSLLPKVTNERLRGMQSLADIKQRHIEIIRMSMNDVLGEYAPDKTLQLRVSSISQTLSENPSIYQLTSEELDIVCMCMNDSLSILDETRGELDAEELLDSQQYSEDITEILSLLQRN